MATGKGKGRGRPKQIGRTQIGIRLSNETINMLDELVEKQTELISEKALFSIEVNRNVIMEYLIQSEYKRMQYALENENYPMPFILNPFNPQEQHEQEEKHLSSLDFSPKTLNVDKLENEVELQSDESENESFEKNKMKL